jgi:putative FmdB family regulatory protein
MPIYEYRCRDCRKKVTVLTLRVSAKPDSCCDHCGSRQLDRILSRFAMPRSEETRLDALSDPSNLNDVDENNPRSMARFMRKMGREMGDDFGGDDFNEMVDEMESSSGDDDSDSGETTGDD